MSAYIPTNVISMTDGQIYLESDLFHAGVRPAINVGLSVSRVGGAAQCKAMKKVAGTLRLELARYRDVAAFAQFGAELDEATRRQIERGKKLVEVLKQGQYQPMRMPLQVVQIYSGVSGRLDAINIDMVKQFLVGLSHHVEGKHPQLLERIESTGDLDGETIMELDSAIDEYSRQFVPKRS